MKSLIFAFIYLSLSLVSCDAQMKNIISDKKYASPNSEVTRFYFTDDNGKDGCGFFDDEKRVLFLSKVYSYISEFKGGYAVAITKSNLTAIAIDSHGKEIIKLSGSEIKTVVGGYGYFRHYPDGDEPEILDINGKKSKIPFTGYSSENIGVCSSYFLDNSNFQYEFYYDFQKKDYLKTSKGSIFKADYCGLFNHGYAVTGKRYGKEIKYGLIDRNTEKLIPFKYNYLESFYGKYCLASNKKNEYILLNTKGKKLLNKSYPYIFAISENIVGLLVNDNNSKFCRLYNIKNGKTLDLPPSVRPFIFYYFDNDYYNGEEYTYNGTFLFYDTEQKKYGLLSDAGDLVLKSEFEEIVKMDNGFWNVKKDGYWYLFNKSSGLLDPVKYLKLL